MDVLCVELRGLHGTWKFGLQHFGGNHETEGERETSLGNVTGGKADKARVWRMLTFTAVFHLPNLKPVSFLSLAPNSPARVSAAGCMPLQSCNFHL